MAHRDRQLETSGRARRAAPKRGGGVVWYLVILLVSFALVFGFVRPFVAEAFWIPSTSMVPTLLVGDRVLVNKFVYRFTEPERGDVVVFESVERGDEDLIKRVVGVPGDEIAVRGGTLSVNGEPQREPYVDEELPDVSSFPKTTVPEGRVFVMGTTALTPGTPAASGRCPKRT